MEDVNWQKYDEKKDLGEAAGVTTNVMAKLGKNENVSTEVLCKICEVLNCEIEDIMDIQKESWLLDM